MTRHSCMRTLTQMTEALDRGDYALAHELSVQLVRQVSACDQCDETKECWRWGRKAAEAAVHRPVPLESVPAPPPRAVNE